MRNIFGGKILFGLAGMMLFLAGCVLGQQAATTQKTLLHVFAYTPLKGSTPQDYANFKRATADMAGKIPGLRRVWVGKLREPLPASGEIREYGVAMEFDDLRALQVYAGHPAHTAWERAYEKVRLRGTTTLDIPGE